MICAWIILMSVAKSRSNYFRIQTRGSCWVFPSGRLPGRLACLSWWGKLWLALADKSRTWTFMRVPGGPGGCCMRAWLGGASSPGQSYREMALNFRYKRRPNRPDGCKIFSEDPFCCFFFSSAPGGAQCGQWGAQF